MFEIVSILSTILTFIIVMGVFSIVFRRKKTILGDATYSSVQRAADERRNKIRTFLDRSEGGTSFSRFIELPEDRDNENFGIRYSQLESISERVAQKIKLEWQLQNDAYLLAERLVDLLIYYNSALSQSVRDPYYYLSFLRSNVPVIKLRRNYVKNDKYFPWKIVISAPMDYWGEVEHFLFRFRNWLPIKIELERSIYFVPHGFCSRAIHREGTVGGVLRNGTGQVYPMTCTHVVADDCHCVHQKGEPKLYSEQPDATLLHANCFINANNLNRKLSVAHSQLVDHLILSRRPVKKVGNVISRKKGIIVGRIIDFPMEGTLFRFPHLEIVPKLDIYFGFLTWPLFHSVFSKPGDSGSWVISEGSDLWVGMVVGGDKFFRKSCVAEAEPLLSFFEELAKQNNSKTELMPYST
jgi:hypothetical protein